MERADQVELQTDDDPSSEDVAAVVGGVVAHNDSVTGSSNHQRLAVFARHDGKIIAGAVGATYYHWLFVSHLWVSDEWRGQDLGTKTLRAIERAAVGRGCRAVWLDTFSFQAKPFYESLGYRPFGQLDEYPPGHSRFFLWKHLDRT